MGDTPKVIGEVLIERPGGAAGQPFLDDILVHAGPADTEAGKARHEVIADRLGDGPGEDLEIGAGLQEHPDRVGTEARKVGEGVEAWGHEGALGRDEASCPRLGVPPYLGSLDHMASSFSFLPYGLSCAACRGSGDLRTGRKADRI